MNIAKDAPGQSDRLMSIDALRGFDMFWITGGHGLLMSAMALRGGPVPDWLKHQMEHARWAGFTAWDLIMPLFLFIVGVSMPFAFASRRRQGQAIGAMCLRILRRVVILFVLGMIVQGNLLAFKLDQLRLFNNTLQAIAAGYLVASVALLMLPVSGQLLLTIGLLVAYWALMMFVPFGNSPAGTLEETANLARHIDHLVIGSYVDGTRYTWVLSSLGFAATVLMGVLGGHVLRSEKRPAVRVGYLGRRRAGLPARRLAVELPLSDHQADLDQFDGTMGRRLEFSSPRAVLPGDRRLGLSALGVSLCRHRHERHCGLHDLAYGEPRDDHPSLSRRPGRPSQQGIRGVSCSRSVQLRCSG